MAEDERDHEQGGAFLEEFRDEYADLATVESQRNDLAAEEFPEGPYGSGRITESLGKSTPWRIDQRAANPASYEDREFHKGRGRVYPGEDKQLEE